MGKILIIGQAPPAIEQQVPYDTTMLYSWLEEVGINQDQAQKMFDFDAVYDKFPGYGFNGHLKPTKEQMESYYKNSLRHKLTRYKKVIILGGVAKDFLRLKGIYATHEVLSLMHPSKRNYAMFNRNRVSIISSLKQFLS